MLNKKINVGFRINPDIDANTLDKISTGRKFDKFGITLNFLPEICRQINNYKYIKLKGISCPYTVMVDHKGRIWSRHIGFNIGDEKKLEEEILELIKFQSLDTLKLELKDSTSINIDNNFFISTTTTTFIFMQY